MINLKLCLANIIKSGLIIGTLAVSIFILYNMIITLTSKDRLRYTLKLFGLDAISNSQLLYTSEAEDDPLTSVLQDHNSIVSWSLGCAGAKNQYSLPMRFSQYVFIGQRISIGDADRLPEGMRELSNEEKQLLIISKSISNQRLSLKSQAENAYSFWATSTVITILLGMMTTILISASSTDFGRGEGNTQRVIRILAIIFPAMGTAVAAIIAFYGPQAEWTQASRTLASLTQLHAQMAMGVWNMDCMSVAVGGERPLKVVLPDWSKRYVDIQTVSVAASGTSNSGGAGSAGVNSGKQSETVKTNTQ